jgi:hypothetical protein
VDVAVYFVPPLACEYHPVNAYAKRVGVGSTSPIASHKATLSDVGDTAPPLAFRVIVTAFSGS